MAGAKHWWQVSLVEKAHGAEVARHDLGAYEAASREGARDLATARYRAMIARLQTARFEIEVELRAGPPETVPLRAKRGARRKDLTRSILESES